MATGEVTVRRWCVARMDQTWGKPMSRAKAEQRVIDMSKKRGGPYQLKFRSDKRWGPKLKIGELRPKLDKRMDDLSLGDVLWVNNDGPREAIVRANVVLTKDDPLDLTNCTETCEVIIADLRAAFPNHLNLGWYNCRIIEGTSTWSQHAWGNAYDAGGPFTVLQAIATHCVNKAIAGALPVAQVIFNHRVWQPGSGWTNYSGVDQHTTHVHITARPEMTGTPPCA